MVFIQSGGKGYQVVSKTAGSDSILVDTECFDTAWNVWLSHLK
jgi:hypothetical protein